MLYLGDCREVLKTLPDDCANVVVTSPPYNMNLRIRNNKHVSRQIVKEISTKYTDYPDNLPLDAYLQLNREVLNLCLMKAPLVFYNVQFLTGNKKALFQLIGEYADTLKEIIVWNKGHAQPAIQHGVLNSQFEVILVFDRTGAISRQFKRCFFERGTLSNVWDIKRPTRKKGNNYHGAVFPDELVATILKAFTDIGDTVLDPFMGTGTTCRVAKQMERKYIGIEKYNSYFNEAKKGLSDE